MSVGPTALGGLIALEAIGPGFPAGIALITFYAGVAELIMAALNLGKKTVLKLKLKQIINCASFSYRRDCQPHI